MTGSQMKHLLRIAALAVALLELSGCVPRPFGEVPIQRPKPDDQLIDDYNVDYMSWLTKHGAERISAAYGLKESRINKTALICFAEYEMSKASPEDREWADRAARLEVPMTVAQGAAMSARTMKHVDEKEAMKLCGITNWNQVIYLNQP